MSIDMLVRQDVMVRHVLNGPTMGSRWSCVFFARDNFPAEPLRHALQAAVDLVNLQMSTWKADSALNSLNAAPVAHWVSLPAELVTVLDASLEIGRASGGLFDIGVGNLVRAWGFGGGHESVDPPNGFPFDAPRNLQLDVTGRRARKLSPIRLDLSGIAKGFGIDELARVMGHFGVRNFLVAIDGDMRAAGTKEGGAPWVIGHERPQAGVRELAGVIAFSNMAVATSGNYRHVKTVRGRTISHTMDPMTGEPVMNDVASVTVLARTCMVADAWATALMVAGSEAALDMARTRELPVLLVRSDGEVLSTL